MQNGLRLRPQRRRDLRVSVSAVGESSPLEAHGAKIYGPWSVGPTSGVDPPVQKSIWHQFVWLWYWPFCSVLTAQSTFSEESSRLIKKPTPHSFNFSSQQQTAPKVVRRFKALGWDTSGSTPGVSQLPTKHFAVKRKFSFLEWTSVEPCGLAADCVGIISHASGTKPGLQILRVTDLINLILHSNGLSVRLSLLQTVQQRRCSWLDWNDESMATPPLHSNWTITSQATFTTV